MKNYKPRICKRCKKEFKPANPNQIYCKECGIVVREEYNKEYRKGHLKETREYNKQYKAKHKKEIKEYRASHKEEAKQYLRTPAGKKANKRHSSRHRQLGFIPLNDYFEGSESHHMNKEFVVYIPKEMHRSVWHCLKTRQGMAKINTLAFKYLLGNYTL